MSYNARHKSLAIIPHFTAGLSVLGSLYIITNVLRSRKKRSSPKHRLLLGMSVSDLIASVFLFLSTWPVPEGGSYGASGNITTCNIQGFMIQLGVACPLYNAFLAIYYLMVVRYGFKDSHFIRAEWYCHAFCWAFAFGTAIASYILELYNNANLFCWIAPLPYECEDSLRNGGETTCIRGDNAWLYRLVFYYIWLWMAVIIVTVCTFMMFWTVYRQAKRVQKFDHKSLKGSKRTAQKHVNRVAMQGILYVGAFYLTATPPSVVRMYQAKYNCTSTYYPLSLATVILFPLQGMWNFLIYIRPKYLSYMKKRRASLSTGSRPTFLQGLFGTSTSSFNKSSSLSRATSRTTNQDHTSQNFTNRDVANQDLTNQDFTATQYSTTKQDFVTEGHNNDNSTFFQNKCADSENESEDKFECEDKSSDLDEDDIPDFSI